MNSFKICNKTTNVDIDLNSAVVTYKTVARILLSVVEFLSYNRNQIPLVYETFNKMVKDLEKTMCRPAQTNFSVNNFTVERQRNLAIQTNKKFDELSNASLYLTFYSISGNELTNNLIQIRIFRISDNVTVI